MIPFSKPDISTLEIDYVSDALRNGPVQNGGSYTKAVEDILSNFMFEFNDASTRLQIKSIVDAYLDNVKSSGGVYEFATVMDESNNTPDIIDQNFAILDIGVEPVRGAQKFINRVTVLKTGGIASGGFTVA